MSVYRLTGSLLTRIMWAKRAFLFKTFVRRQLFKLIIFFSESLATKAIYNLGVSFLLVAVTYTWTNYSASSCYNNLQMLATRQTCNDYLPSLLSITISCCSSSSFCSEEEGRSSASANCWDCLDWRDNVDGYTGPASAGSSVTCSTWLELSLCANITKIINCNPLIVSTVQAQCAVLLYWRERCFAKLWQVRIRKQLCRVEGVACYFNFSVSNMNGYGVNSRSNYSFCLLLTHEH